MNMKEFFKKYTKQSKKGFTMVEVIAVIIILSIISTATVSVFLSVQTTVRDTSKLTTQQYTTTQMEKFMRNELQTASSIDVREIIGGLPDGVEYKENDEYLYYDPNTMQLIFSVCDSIGNYKNKLIIDQVEDVTIDICPINFSSTDTSNMPFKLIYKVKTTSYTYSGGIVLGNSYVDDADTFASASHLFADLGGNIAKVHWHKNESDGTPGSDDYTNDYSITFHAVGTQNTGS